MRKLIGPIFGLALLGSVVLGATSASAYGPTRGSRSWTEQQTQNFCAYTHVVWLGSQAPC